MNKNVINSKPINERKMRKDNSISLPRNVRDRVGINGTNSAFEFNVTDSGEIILKPKVVQCPVCESVVVTTQNTSTDFIKSVNHHGFCDKCAEGLRKTIINNPSMNYDEAFAYFKDNGYVEKSNTDLTAPVKKQTTRKKKEPVSKSMR